MILKNLCKGNSIIYFAKKTLINQPACGDLSYSKNANYLSCRWKVKTRYRGMKN